MNEEILQSLAAQLRKPQGEWAIKTGNRMSETNATMYALVFQLITPKQNDQILEIGMGNGHFVGELLAQHPTVQFTGVDYSDEMVEESIRNNYQWIKNKRAIFKCGNAANLPFANKLFNIIFTINTLYFWESPRSVLLEIKRVLKPGAILIIAIRPQNIMEQYPFTRYGFQLYSKLTLTELLNNNGFLVKDVLEASESDVVIADQTYKAATLVIIAQNP